MLSDITTGPQTVSAAGAVTGVLSTADILATADLTVRLHILGMTAAKNALISFEDTALAGVNAFTDAHQVAVVHVAGAVSSEIQLNFRRYQLPTIRTGAANCALRVNVQAIDAGGNLTIYGQLEY